MIPPTLNPSYVVSDTSERELRTLEAETFINKSDKTEI